MVRKLLDQESISPDEIAMLQRVFDAICPKEKRTTEAANSAGLELFRLFRAGFKDERSLLAEMQLRKWEQGSDSSGPHAAGR